MSGDVAGSRSNVTTVNPRSGYTRATDPVPVKRSSIRRGGLRCVALLIVIGGPWLRLMVSVELGVASPSAAAPGAAAGEG